MTIAILVESLGVVGSGVSAVSLAEAEVLPAGAFAEAEVLPAGAFAEAEVLPAGAFANSFSLSFLLPVAVSATGVSLLP
ncbi:hypothetical protein ROQ65_07995 [Lactobacillus crispatus]|uniref:hypothetical protein n=1 Tax=Lactobacillus crispatus TaxID=47770 RepID=UPI0028E95B36|nr:hypothetical protein [Lactobacillus crispatus]MDT9604492.1 hypothetical protein [Lactobacillus crispatus]